MSRTDKDVTWSARSRRSMKRRGGGSEFERFVRSSLCDRMVFTSDMMKDFSRVSKNVEKYVDVVKHGKVALKDLSGRDLESVRDYLEDLEAHGVYARKNAGVMVVASTPRFFGRFENWAPFGGSGSLDRVCEAGSVPGRSWMGRSTLSDFCLVSVRSRVLKGYASLDSTGRPVVGSFITLVGNGERRPEGAATVWILEVTSQWSYRMSFIDTSYDDEDDEVPYCRRYHSKRNNFCNKEDRVEDRARIRSMVKSVNACLRESSSLDEDDRFHDDEIERGFQPRRRRRVIKDSWFYD